MADDRHWAGSLPGPAHTKTETQSLFVTTRDGTRIAIDVHLPSNRRDDALPTIVRQTRYMRKLAPRSRFAKWIDAPKQFDVHHRLRTRFLNGGYAWVDVDVRGTGASSGMWRSPWFEDQRRDAYDLVDWIVRQPWSNGRVGSLGISYDGTCADMMLAEPHPAVRAVAPLFSLYDVFPDVAFPGGIHHAWFTEAWAHYNHALDHNDHHHAMATPLWWMARAASSKPDRSLPELALGSLARLGEARFRSLASTFVRSLIRGVADVERSGDGLPSSDTLRTRARNLDVHRGAKMIAYRDDGGVDPEMPELTIDSFSPHTYRDAQRASGAAIYSYSGWRDGAYPHSAIKRFLTVRNPGSRLTLGPWAHTGLLAIHGFSTGVATQFDHGGELVAFFDSHLLSDARGANDDAPVHYFTTGEEKWKSSSTWPPPGFESNALHLSPKRLSNDPSSEARVEARNIDESTGTGVRSRWRSLLSLVPGDYPDRRARDSTLLTYDSPPLDEAIEVTGHPIVTLFVSWSRAEDAHVFAYLEDIAPDGTIWYVSEGQLSALHRAVSDGGDVTTPGVQRSFRRADARAVRADEVVEMKLDLLPFSHVFRAGHRVRLALAASDVDHFVRPAHGELRIHLGPTTPSRIELPTNARPRFRNAP